MPQLENCVLGQTGKKKLVSRLRNLLYSPSLGLCCFLILLKERQTMDYTYKVGQLLNTFTNLRPTCYSLCGRAFY